MLIDLRKSLISLLFQFLYGTIKIKEAPLMTVDEISFQFLYGTIKIIANLYFRTYYPMFQFLYGTIKISCPSSKVAQIDTVSIPIWYD